MNLAAGSQLVQSRPSGTTATSVYTASLATEISLIVVCNTTASNSDFSLYHDDDGSTFDQTSALFYAVPVAGNTTVTISSDSIGAGLQVAASGQIAVQTSVANALTFTIYGTTEDIASHVG